VNDNNYLPIMLSTVDSIVIKCISAQVNKCRETLMQ